MRSNSEIFKIFGDYKSQIKTDLDNTKFVNSLKCLFNKTEQIISITDDIKRTKNTYTTQILLRSIIEHFLIGFYVFLRVKIDKTDEVGDEYYDFYQNSEFLKQETYSIQIEDIQNRLDDKVDVKRLKKKFPHLENLEQKDLESYHFEGNKFANLKNIAKFLIKNGDFEPKLQPITAKLVDLVDLYNYLSSYVHGGPFAERELLEMNKSEIEKLEKKTIDWADVLSSISINILLLSMTYEKPEIYSSIFSQTYKK
jgi:hypothetical protein